MYIQCKPKIKINVYIDVDGGFYYVYWPKR